MGEERYCDNCGKSTMEYDRGEWAAYCMSDGEELVSIYKCTECDYEMTIRDSEREG